MAEQDQQFVEFVVKSLVDHPDDVKSERTVDEMGVLISLHLSPEDMGQVIGRSGQTAKAIRTLLRVVGAKHKARVNLKIVEPEGSTHRPRTSSTSSSVFDCSPGRCPGRDGRFQTLKIKTPEQSGVFRICASI